MDKNISAYKTLYLKYFPTHEEGSEMLVGESAKTEGDSAERDEDVEKERGLNTDKNCVYCGSSQLRPYGSNNNLICEDCRVQFVSSKQEFTFILLQVKESLELLIDTSFNEPFIVVCTRNWLQKCKHYLGRVKEERDDFGGDYVSKKIMEKEITFFIHKEMPRSTYIYIISGYIMGEFLKKEFSGISETKAYCAIMKWCALWYMNMIGYTDFCRWKAKAELQDEEYKKWEEKLGTPLENRREIMTILNNVLKKAMEENVEGADEEQE